MAYEEDRDMDLDRSLYEEDPAYEADTYFGERLDEPVSDEMEADEYEDEDVPGTTEAVDAPDTEFGESIQSDKLEETDEMEDADKPTESEDRGDSLLEKAKHKIDEWSDRDAR